MYAHPSTLVSFTAFHEFLRQYKVGAQCIKILAQVRHQKQYELGFDPLALNHLRVFLMCLHTFFFSGEGGGDM